MALSRSGAMKTGRHASVLAGSLFRHNPYSFRRKPLARAPSARHVPRNPSAKVNAMQPTTVAATTLGRNTHWARMTNTNVPQAATLPTTAAISPVAAPIRPYSSR